MSANIRAPTTLDPIIGGAGSFRMPNRSESTCPLSPNTASGVCGNAPTTNGNARQMIVIRSSPRRPGVRLSPTREEALPPSAISPDLRTRLGRPPAFANRATPGNIRDSIECPSGFFQSCVFPCDTPAFRNTPAVSRRRVGEFLIDFPAWERVPRGTTKCDFIVAAFPFRSLPPRGGEKALRRFGRADASDVPETRYSLPSIALSHREGRCAT